MRLDTLYIRRLPGLNAPLRIETFGPGVNVITGPNASGKSSLLRALRLLIAPRNGDPANLMIEALFTHGEQRWRAERFGRDVIWQLNGEPHDPPPLPDADSLGGYFLPVDELLRMTRSDQAIAAHLRRELAGGYDLAALREEGSPLAIHPRRDRQAGDALKTAEKTLREAEAGNRSLLAERQRLPELQAAIQHASEGLQRLEHCNAALALVDARAATREAQARLATFPEVMPEGIDAAELQQLEQRCQQEGTKAREARAAMDAAEQRLHDTGLTGDPAEDPDVAAMRQRLDEIRELTVHLEQAREQTQRDAARVTENQVLLGGISEKPPAVDQRGVARLEEAAQTLSEALAHWHQVSAEADASAASAQTESGRRDNATLWLDRLAITITGSALAAMGYGSYTATPAVALAAAGSAAVALGWLLWRSVRQAPNPTSGPQLEQRLAAARSRLDHAREQLRTLASDMGLELEADTLPYHFQLLVQRLLRFDEARVAHGESSARCKYMEDRREPLLDQLTGFLEAWHTSAPGREPGDLARALEQLDKRVQTAAEARRDRVHQKDEAARAESAEQDASAALERLYERAGVAFGERDTLLARLQDLPAWRQARESLQTARIRENDAHERLRDGPDDLVALAEADDRAGLTEQLHHARARADEHDPLVREEERIHQRLREAERHFRLEEARAERDQAREALAERLDQRMLAEAGRFLLDDAEADHRRDHQPRAARRADQWLRRFTHDGFALEIDDGGEPCARETTSGERRELAALSVGTRMQLLLALRMAWVEQQEQGQVTLPLMLDEALTTTDPLRFDAIATTLHALTRDEGRQLLYLSAQPEDAERWQRATGEPPRVIDLNRVRGGATASSPEALALPTHAPIPEPDPEDPDGYAATLGVPTVDPRAGAGIMHLFHVLRDDLPTLHRLLQGFRVATVGQAESFLQSTAATKHLDETVIARLQRRITAARAWIDAWRVGRGTPVDRPLLEQSPMGKWKHLDAIVERAETVDGDPEALLESLRTDRIPGIGTSRVGQIEEWLQQNGLVDDRPRLDTAQRYHQVLGRLTDTPGALDDAQRVVNALEAATDGEKGVDRDAPGADVMPGW